MCCCCLLCDTGTYSNLPAAIQDMRGPKPAQEQEQQRLINQMNHLLYAHLLKVRCRHYNAWRLVVCM